MQEQRRRTAGPVQLVVHLQAVDGGVSRFGGWRRWLGHVVVLRPFRAILVRWRFRREGQGEAKAVPFMRKRTYRQPPASTRRNRIRPPMGTCPARSSWWSTTTPITG